MTINPTLAGGPGQVVHEHHHPELSKKQKNAILAAMCIALIAVVSSVSGLNTAQQKITEDLGTTQSEFLWVTNGYTLALAALLMPIGAIGDRWSRRKILLGGLTIYLVSNLLGAFASGTGMLITTRVIAGIGASMIMPVTLSVITSTFHGEERERAIGIWSGFAGAGAILGMFISSVIVDNFNWPLVFVLPIVLAVLAAVLASKNVVDIAEHHEGRFDVFGGVLSALAVGGLVFGIHEGPEKGWGEAITLVPLAVGVLATVAFILYELRHENPLLNVRVFKNRMLSAGTGLLFLIFIVMMGLFLVMPQFLMGVLGWGAVKATAGLLPMAAAMMPLSTVSPLIARKTGTRFVFILGFSMAAVGLAIVATMVSAETGYLSILPGLMIMGAGIGLSMTPGTSAITGSLPAEDQGIASALNDSVREIGASIGIAFIGSILSSGYADRMGEASGKVTELAATMPSLPDGLTPDGAGELVKEGIFQALGMSQQLAQIDAFKPQAGELLVSAQHAFVDSWSNTMWIGAGIAAFAAVLAAILAPSKDKENEFRVDRD